MKLLSVVVILSFALIRCQQAAQAEPTNCPEKYEGQLVTIAGKITKTASFLGLANLTTLEDSKNGICVVISKKSLGNEGDKVRLENMVAVKATNTVVPNFLRTVEDASIFTPGSSVNASANASARVSAMPTLDLTSVRKIGQAVSYPGSWRVTLVKVEEQAPGSAITSKSGTRLITVTVRYDNGGTKEVAASPSDWKLQDSTGVRREATTSSRSDTLQRGTVAPGGFVSGALVFEVPAEDKKLSVLYQVSGYNPTSWELY